MKTLAVRRSLAVAATAALVALGSVAFAAPAAADQFDDVDTELELVDAINLANGNDESDTIYLTGSGFTLTDDLPDITTDITITGPGSGSFTLNGDAAHDMFNLAGAVGTPIDVSISGISITNATISVRSTQANLSLEDLNIDSIGVYANDGDLSIVDSVVESTAGHGLEVYAFANQTVSIVSSSFNTNNNLGISLQASENSDITFSNVGADSNRGGMRLMLFDDATMTATGTIATDSSDINHGISLEVQGGSSAIFTDTTVTGNSGDGFSIDAFGTADVTVQGLIASNNQSDGFEFWASGDPIIVVNDATTTFNDNEGAQVVANGDSARIDLNRLNSSDNSQTGLDVAMDGGAINVTASQIRRNAGGGVVVSAEGSDGILNITTTTIDDNEAEFGGGVRIDPMPGYVVTITESTISNNAGGAGGGIFANLGDETSLALINSTVSGNLSSFVGGVYIATDAGAPLGFTAAHSTITGNTTLVEGTGGLYVSGAPAEVDHTILAGNTGVDAGAGDLDLFTDDALVNYSLVQDAGAEAEAFAGAGTGNILGFSANLGPLADNGGPTLTHLPLATSRALGAGNAAIVGQPITDQRGEARIVGIIDIGAVEVAAILPATGVEPSKTLIGGILVLSFGMLLLAVAAWRKSRAYL